MVKPPASHTKPGFVALGFRFHVAVSLPQVFNSTLNNLQPEYSSVGEYGKENTAICSVFVVGASVSHRQFICICMDLLFHQVDLLNF